MPRIPRRYGDKHREKIHRYQEAWLARQEGKEEDRINALAITGGRRQLARRFQLVGLARSRARQREQELLATTSLKDLIK